MKLQTPTKVCKKCFNKIKCDNISYFLDSNSEVCSDCKQELKSKFYSFKLDGVKCLALYDYDETFQDLIFKFKGCFDYELRTIFLDKYKRELSIFYKNYYVIPAPSYIDDDKCRGFNHVEAIFEELHLPILHIFEKTKKHKQSDQKFVDRDKIKNYLKINDSINLLNKNILLVDDIFTTGSTMRTMIELIKKKNVKKIKVLVLCKTKGK